MAKPTCNCPCHRPVKSRPLPRWKAYVTSNVDQACEVEADSHYRAVQTASVILKCDPSSVSALVLDHPKKETVEGSLVTARTSQ